MNAPPKRKKSSKKKSYANVKGEYKKYKYIDQEGINAVIDKLPVNELRAYLKQGIIFQPMNQHLTDGIECDLDLKAPADYEISCGTQEILDYYNQEKYQEMEYELDEKKEEWKQKLEDALDADDDRMIMEIMKEKKQFLSYMNSLK